MERAQACRVNFSFRKSNLRLVFIEMLNVAVVNEA